MLKILKIKECNNNLSYFLNIMDGLNECTGRIIIMTTNKIDHLDKALIRPGRIDIKIKFDKCTLDDIYKMICLFWKDQVDFNLEDLDESLNKKYTSAEIVNIFRKANNYNDFKNSFIK